MRLTFLMILLSVLPAFGWKNNLSEYDEIAIGKDAKGNMVNARYVYYDEQPQMMLNVVGKPFIIFLMKKEVVVYNYITGERKCIFKIPKNSTFVAIFENGLLFQKDVTKGFMSFSDREYALQFYDFDGDLRWETNGKYSMGDRKNNIVVSAKTRKDKSGKDLYNWTARDVSTGEKLWENCFGNTYHDINCSQLNLKTDSVIRYFLADSLIRFNMRTGEMLSRPFNSGHKASKTDKIVWSAQDTIPDVTLNKEMKGSLINYGPMTGTHSNWVERGDTLIIADADSLYAFDRNLKTYWSAALPDGKGAKSRIYCSGDSILFFNYGVAFCEGYRKKYGAPFAASFDIADGKMISVTIPDFKDYVISGDVTEDGRIYWQTKDDFFYSDEGNNELHKIKWKSPSPYMHNDLRVKNRLISEIGQIRGNTLQYTEIDRNNILVTVESGDSFIIQPETGIQKVVPSKEAYFRLSDNVAYTNKDHRGQRDYIYHDPDTGQIIFRFKSMLLLSNYKDSHLIFYIPKGIGIVDLKQFKYSENLQL